MAREGTAKESAAEQGISSWDAALGILREWDPVWADHCVKMETDPWTSGVLSTKFIELVLVALNAGRTNLNPDGTRRHIRAALAAGANREEILFVLKVAAVMSIHSCMFGTPILMEESSAGSLQDAAAMRAKLLQKAGQATANVEKIKAIGQWNEEWDSLLFLAPVWADEFMSMCVPLYTPGVFSRKEIELLGVALDASYTHMYAPLTRRHMKNAFRAGATVDEIMEVLKLCVVQGVQACNLGVPILAEELERNASRADASAAPVDHTHPKKN